ncbi:hypothetical protein [Cyanobacterium sp. HL-69]|uniref:hypothetical protein n=1 Tax=Cyanobacterium sp. HL-69 TaxID=2054282 RepID=UPI00406BBEB2
MGSYFYLKNQFVSYHPSGGNLKRGKCDQKSYHSTVVHKPQHRAIAPISSITGVKNIRNN